MPLIEETRRVFIALLGGTDLRHAVFPAGAIPVVITAGAGAYAWGAAYTQIVAGATVTADSLIYGVHLANAALDDFYVRIGLGAGAAEVQRAVVPIDGNNTSGIFIPLPLPIFVLAGTRIAADAMSGTGGNAVSVKVAYVTGF